MKLFKKFDISNQAVICMAIVYGFNMLVYEATRLTFTDATIFHNMSISLDSKIPFAPFMILFYGGWFPYLVINFYLITSNTRDKAIHFVSAHVLGEFIAGIIFMTYPTMMERPVVTGNDIFSLLVKFTFFMDSPNNLFPSIHCFAATMAVLGTIGRKDLPWQFRLFNVFFALCVYASTVMIRQHVLVDIPAGIGIALVGWFSTYPFVKLKKS